MEILQDYSIEQLRDLLAEYGEKPFRAGQIFRGLAAGKKISELTELSLSLRAKLKERFADEAVRIVGKKISSVDGTVKFLFALWDGNVIEGVLMRYKYGNTQCVSTQVGCRVGCAFCASGIGGLVRNLTAGEIASEIYAVNRYLGGTTEKRQVTNVVMMGSGEPLDNYENSVRFLRLISAKDGLNVSPRNVSLSTCGIVPAIDRLSEEGLDVNLTVSLHNPFDERRRELMPIAKKYGVSEILDACSHYFQKTGRRYIFEYSLVKGQNDGRECADELIRLLKGRPCHVNLIRLNAVKEKNLEATSDKDAYRFLGLLERGGLSATVRRQIGVDIDGACGQLRRKFLNGEVEFEGQDR
ncbi:MAG: 23S rRNA (adenine(2503)-C(2))-methyltransferase RlmN [Candidatus Borkfalkiaceae bacterium]|nr:23S rRNA (adenine(2503)-C(2))-methyltransferase RlmN [Christensenellaceae bacterium]